MTYTRPADPNVQAILDKLDVWEDVPGNLGRGWFAGCPRHSNHERVKLEVTVRLLGRVVVECGKRCPASKIARALGLPSEALEDPPPPPNAEPPRFRSNGRASPGRGPERNGKHEQHEQRTTGDSSPNHRAAGDEDEPVIAPEFVMEDAGDFLKGSYPVTWLVDWFLVRGAPAVIAGPSKGMKTSLLIDLAVSLASGTPFLKKWSVPKRVRTALVSAESGKSAIQETCLRVLAARGLGPDDVAGWLKFEFKLPTLSDLGSVRAFGDALATVDADVVTMDPTYLTLGEVDEKSMFRMGPALAEVVKQLCKIRPGLTVALVHHANRRLMTGDPMELTDIAYAGFDQFARQWLLINRRKKYVGDGRHELWLNYGGNHGASGLSVLNIEEGVLGAGKPARTWAVSVSSPGDATETETQDRERVRQDRKRKERDADRDAVLGAIRALIGEGKQATANAIRVRTELSLERTKVAIEWLESSEIIESSLGKVKTGKAREQEVRVYEIAPSD